MVAGAQLRSEAGLYGLSLVWYHYCSLSFPLLNLCECLSRRQSSCFLALVLVLIMGNILFPPDDVFTWLGRWHSLVHTLHVLVHTWHVNLTLLCDSILPTCQKHSLFYMWQCNTFHFEFTICIEGRSEMWLLNMHILLQPEIYIRDMNELDSSPHNTM